MEPRISFVTLGVGDIENSMRFYQDVLRLPKLASPPGISFFDMGGTWLALHPRHERAAPTGAAIPDISKIPTDFSGKSPGIPISLMSDIAKEPSMIRLLAAALAAICLNVSDLGAGEPPVTPKAVTDRVQVQSGSLAWDIFRLGMKLDELQTILEKEVGVVAGSEGNATIDRYAADLVHRGVPIHVTFESDDPSSALVYIRAGFAAGSAPNVAALTDGLAARVKGLVPTEGSSSLLLEGTDYQAAVKEDGVHLGAVWLF